VNELLQARLKQAISTMTIADFERIMHGASNVDIALETLAVVPALPHEVQDWWYQVMWPIVRKRAEAEVPDEVQQANHEWSELHRADAVIISHALQTELCVSGGLLYGDLMQRLEAVKPRLPHPDCGVKDIAALLLIELLYRGAVWQTDEGVFHASEDSRLKYPEPVASPER
jgi:hypothetical protein